MPSSRSAVQSDYEQPGDKPEDGELVAGLKRRNDGAARQAYRSYCDAIYRYVYYQVGDVEVAEDIVSEVFVRMLERIHTYSYQGIPFSAWLYRIAHNLVADYFRTHARINRESVDGLDDGTLRAADTSDPAAAAELSLTIDQLQRAIACLTEEQRRVVLLKFVEDMDNRQVASILGKSESAVKSLQCRALEGLRRVLLR